MLNAIRISATWQTLFFLTAAILGIAVLAFLSAKGGAGRRLAGPALALYALAAAYVTLLSRKRLSVRFVRLHPLRAYRFALRRFLEYNRNRKTRLPRLTWEAREMILNVVLFLPVGALLSCLFPHMRPRRAAAIGFLASLAIECLQLFFRLGTFDLCDLIHNTLGTVLGFLLFRGLEKGLKRRG